MKKLNINPILYLSISILYLELIMKNIITKNIINNEIILLIIFLLPLVLLLTILTKAFNKIVNKIILFITMILLTVYFEVQLIFYILFSVPFSFSTISLADQASDFSNIVIDTIKTNILTFTLLLIPLIFLILFYKKINTERYNKYQIITLIIMFITSYLSTFAYLLPNKNESNSLYKLYFNTDDAERIINNFGLLNYTKIDIKRDLMGYEQELTIEFNETESEMPPVEIEEGEEIIDYGYNQLELNFEESDNNTINQLNNYIQNKQSSNKNEYTGMFEGKNLIFILAEGFNEIAVDEVRTPTLYKMINTGFNFTNFYSPVFLSTTGGEFQATTGLIPTQETLKAWKEKTPTISYAIGNSYANKGYRTYSFHDWTYTYYKRNITMQTLGFTNYLGCGNGLEKRMRCSWLPKDSEMINVTFGDYANMEGPFATYYVTVSGHSPYNNSDNIAKEYLSNLEGTSYSSQVKYYLAAQMELDKMLEQLVLKLTETGELDNTVIALVGDHYPYTLSTEEVNEVSSYEKDGTIEVNRSNFIIWNSQIEEPIVVDKVGSQIDVLPTLLNLFGIDYDSRLIVGQDILSNYEGIAIFSNRSWVTDYGWYYVSQKRFVLKEGKTLEDQEAYINRINNRVANSFSVSKMILDTNYYNYILNK